MLINGIIGFPLKNPRSIPIWKSFFKKKKIKAIMKKFEIKPSLLKRFIKDIRQNKKFKATAVTMPYKKKICRYLDQFDEFANSAKSVNLILKKNNKLIGFNTDVYGANETIKKIIKDYNTIIIIGLGGTGSAIFNFFKMKFKIKKFILISKKFKIKKIKKIKNIKIHKTINSNILLNKSLIINCSPLGSNLKKSFIRKSPISKKLIKVINKKSTIFDIIYSPKNTYLSKLAKKNKIKYINGKFMNTIQAHRALEIVFGKR
jgi:shikimate dehydrogenase